MVWLLTLDKNRSLEDTYCFSFFLEVDVNINDPIVGLPVRVV